MSTFGAWDLLPFILNASAAICRSATAIRRCRSRTTDRERAINDLAEDLPPIWDGAPLDAPIMHAALECLRTRRPRVLYVMLGETDEWAHEGRYDLYLDAASAPIGSSAALWEAAQSMPEYAGRRRWSSRPITAAGRPPRTGPTTAGRCPPPNATWMAVMGPGTPAARRARGR